MDKNAVQKSQYGDRSKRNQAPWNVGNIDPYWPNFGDKMKLPKVIYVYAEKDSDGIEYLVASKTPEGEHGTKIGIYRLEGKRTLVIKQELIR